MPPFPPSPSPTHRSLSLHKASASLSALNEFSTAKWTTLSPRFDAHTKLIKELQADLDHVFRKIRTIKARLNLPNQGDDEEDDNRHAEVEAQTDTGVIGDRNEEREPEVAGE